MFRARPRDPDRIRLLEGVVANHECRNLSGKQDDRDRIHQCVGQAGDGVRRARAGRDQDHARAPGGAGVAFGRVDCALFVAHEDVPDPVLLKDLVIDWKHRPARVAKYDVDPLVLQRFHDHARAGHLLLLHCACPLCSARKKTPGRMGVLSGIPSPVHAPCPHKYYDYRSHHRTPIQAKDTSSVEIGVNR